MKMFLFKAESSNRYIYILNKQYDISNNSQNQPYIPNSTLSTPPNQSIPTAPTQVLPAHFEQNNARPKKECNCRERNSCPLNGKCLIKSKSGVKPYRNPTYRNRYV